MAIIGKNKAVVDIPSPNYILMDFAWLIWLFIHLISLIIATECKLSSTG
jgi:hypothetical protein